jgi:hypothetical protein
MIKLMGAENMIWFNKLFGCKKEQEKTVQLKDRPGKKDFGC